MLENGAKVYKLIGPALLRQDLNEVKQNINKRLEFIINES
jgi:Prefoldin subunit.